MRRFGRRSSHAHSVLAARAFRPPPGVRQPSVREAIDARAVADPDITIISSAGARALADGCTAWTEKNKLVVAMAVVGWGGNLIEFHAMEGAAANFPQPGALPVVLNGQVIGAMGVSNGDGERCAQAAIDVVFKGKATTVGR
jgi:uncharacterized protein GlcG (DUF336 family)